MKAKLTFHILSSITSFILVFSLGGIHEYVIENFVRSIAYLKGGDEFWKTYFYSVVFYSWIFPFTIYIVKNYRKHFWIFLGILVTTVLIMSIRLLLNNCIHTEWENCILHLVYYIFIQQETLIAALLISATIYFIQLFIGKRFLPHYYK